MKNSFFEETAEDMVGRLIKQNTFPFLTNHLKSRLIFHLKNFDNDSLKGIEDNQNGIRYLLDPENSLCKEFFKDELKSKRELLVLYAYIKLSQKYNEPLQKSTHRQIRQKPNHLRLVVKN